MRWRYREPVETDFENYEDYLKALEDYDYAFSCAEDYED